MYNEECKCWLWSRRIFRINTTMFVLEIIHYKCIVRKNNIVSFPYTLRRWKTLVLNSFKLHQHIREMCNIKFVVLFNKLWDISTSEVAYRLAAKSATTTWHVRSVQQQQRSTFWKWAKHWERQQGVPFLHQQWRHIFNSEEFLCTRTPAKSVLKVSTAATMLGIVRCKFLNKSFKFSLEIFVTFIVIATAIEMP